MVWANYLPLSILNRHLRNQLINLFWTVLGFAPIVIYWYKATSLLPLYVFCAVSLAGAFVPQRFYQLSRRLKFYRRMGVLQIRALVQDGDWAKAASAANQTVKPSIRNREQARRYLHTIRMYENFHWVCFLFFLLSSGHAFVVQQYFWGSLILFVNLIYNAGPILLQQYNRARITGIFHSRLK